MVGTAGGRQRENSVTYIPYPEEHSRLILAVLGGNAGGSIFARITEVVCQKRGGEGSALCAKTWRRLRRRRAARGDFETGRAAAPRDVLRTETGRRALRGDFETGRRLRRRRAAHGDFETWSRAAWGMALQEIGRRAAHGDCFAGDWESGCAARRALRGDGAADVGFPFSGMVCSPHRKRHPGGVV